MKKIKIFAVITALVMLMGCIVSCNSTTSTTVNCTISVVAGGDYIVDGVECPLKAEENTAPVVLDALKMALDFCEVDYELSSNGLSKVVSNGTEYAQGSKEDGFWFWNYTVNGVEPENGSAAINEVKDGDVIVYSFTLLETEEETEPEAENEEETEESADEEAEG